MASRVVANPDGTALAFLGEMGHSFPGLLSLPGYGPVYEIQVNVVESKPFQTPITGTDCRVVAMVTVPEFCRYEDLVPGDVAGFDPFADLLLIPVNFSGIKEAIAKVNGVFQSVSCRLPLRRLPSSQAEVRHLDTIVQLGP